MSDLIWQMVMLLVFLQSGIPYRVSPAFIFCTEPDCFHSHHYNIHMSTLPEADLFLLPAGHLALSICFKLDIVIMSVKTILMHKLPVFRFVIMEEKSMINKTLSNESGTEKKENSENNRAAEIAVTGIFTALTYVFTWLINIRLPLAGSGGLIHLGNVPLFIAAMLFGRKTGCIAGGVGMGLFDLLSGWTAWAPFTFIIVGFMGYTVGWFAERKPIHHMFVNDLVSLLLALLIKIVGYYFAEVILYGNWITPVGSIPGNILQVGTAAIIVLAIIPQLRKAAHKALQPLTV